MLKYLMYSIFLLSPIMSQTDPDTSSSDDGGEEQKYAMNTSVYVDFSKNTGNTTAEILYYGLSFGLFGDYGPLKDTEFSFSYSANDAVVSGEQWEDDANLILKFDLWASQRFSPFLFFQKSFDNIIGLEDRVNFGLGGKVEVFGPLSVSYAILWETEDYLNSTTMDYDSALVDWYNYTDSTWWGEYECVMTAFDSDYYYWVTVDTTIDGVYYVYTDSRLVYAYY